MWVLKKNYCHYKLLFLFFYSLTLLQRYVVCGIDFVLTNHREECEKLYLNFR